MTKEKCSFCGSLFDDSKHIIESQISKASICDSCITLSHEIISDADANVKPDNEVSEVPTTKELKAILDQYVVGQDKAKKTLSIAISNHFKRLESKDDNDDVVIEKSNILMYGATGVGKTYLAKTLAKHVGLPIAIADATSITEAGYAGDDIESIITKLYQAANCDIELTQKGIIFVDEIDKKAKKTSMTNARDSSGEGVQQALLKIMEGTDVIIPTKGTKKLDRVSQVTIDTSNILFILSGAFVGLEDIAKGGKHLGFGKPEEKDTSIKTEHIIKFGMIPELVGRVPVITGLHELSEQDLIDIMTEPKNSITKQYQKLFKISGLDLVFEKDCLEHIAQQAIINKTGARGLRSIFEEILHDIQFNLDEYVDRNVKTIIITKDQIINHTPPKTKQGRSKQRGKLTSEN